MSLAYIQDIVKIAQQGGYIDFFAGNEKKNTNLEWQNTCTRDVAEIMRRAEAATGNYSIIAKAEPDALLVLDDDGGIRALYEEKHGRLSATLKLATPNGGFHYPFKHSARSLALHSEIGKAYISEPKPDGKGELWSLRIHNSYIVGPGSKITKKDGTQGEYKIAYHAPIAEIPDSLLDFLVERWKAQNKTTKTPVTLTGDMIEYGSHDTELTRIAGKLRQVGMEEEMIAAALIEVCEKRCEGYGSDYKEMCEKIARSVCTLYPVGKETTVLVNGRVAGQGQVQTIAPAPSNEDIQDRIDRSAVIEPPKPPLWTMQGTSIYRNLCEPASRTSNKLPFLIFMPTMATYLNYLSTRVRIKGQENSPLTIFLGSIACKGTFKSSCAELGFRYLNMIGISQRHSGTVSNANGKQLIMTVGSTEGLGLAMETTRCKQVVLYYDELRKASKKMGIEHSAFSSDLITMYESGDFTNGIKSTKASFFHPAGTYCVSWIFCTTIKSFHEVWPKIMGNNSDLIDRMFFVLGPESVKESDHVNLFTDPDFTNSCAETRALIDRALNQKSYEYEDYDTAQQMLKTGLEGLSSVESADGDDSLDLSMSRLVGLVQKLALFFAVDLGLDCIDSECLERAIALVRYRCNVIRYLRPIEADTPLGRLQQLMLHTLRSNQGQMPTRRWKQLCNYNRHDSEIWWRAETGLKKQGRIIFFEKGGMSGRTKSFVGLLKPQDDDRS